ALPWERDDGDHLHRQPRAFMVGAVSARRFHAPPASLARLAGIALMTMLIGLAPMQRAHAADLRDPTRPPIAHRPAAASAAAATTTPPPPAPVLQSVLTG